MSPIEVFESPEVTEMKEMLKKRGHKINCEFGDLTVSNGTVMFLENPLYADDSDTFLISHLTCTAVVLLTCHAGKVGSIVANYDDETVVYKENYTDFGNIYLSKNYKYVTDTYNTTFATGKNAGTEYRMFEVSEPKYKGKRKSKYMACSFYGVPEVIDIDDYSKRGFRSVFRLDAVE